MPTVHNFARVNNEPLAATVNRQFRMGKEEKKEIEDIFGPIDRDNEIDHIYSQHQYYGTINDALKERLAIRFQSKVYGLLKYEYWSPYTSYLYPWHQIGPNDPDVIEWDELKMEEGIADRLAPLGIPRIYSSTRTKRGDTMERRGAGIFIEDGFFTSPEGRAMWRYQVAQLAAVTQRTCEYDVMTEMLNAWVNQPKRVFQLGYSIDEQTPGDSYKDFVTSDITTFGMINKSEGARGVMNVINRFDDLMDMIGDGSKPDTLVLPPNMRSFFYMNKDDLWSYKEAGPQAYENQKRALDKSNPRGVDLKKFMDFNVVDTKIYRSVTQSRREAGDLLTTNRQIGDWMWMHAWDTFSEVADFENYKTKHRNVNSFNMEQDMFGVIPLVEALRSSHRWKRNVAEYSDEFNRYIEVINDSVHGGDSPDMFVYFSAGGLAQPVRCWAQVEPKYLCKDSIDAMIKTFDKANVTEEEKQAYLLPENSFDASQRKLERWKKSPVHRLKTTLEAIEWALSKNIHIPITVLLMRPSVTFSVSSGIICKAGEETGKMFIGRQDFKITNDSLRKCIAGSWTFHSKAVTLEPRNIMGMEDIFVQRYTRGGNNNFYGPAEIDQVRNNGGVDGGDKSIIAMAISESLHGRLLNMNDLGNTLDVRGVNSGLKNYATVEESWLFPCAQFYNQLLNVESTFVSNPASQEKDFEGLSYKPNTLVHRQFFEYGPDFNHCWFGTGHLGQNLYPGVMKTFTSYEFAPRKDLYGSKMRHSS